ncbi:MAG: hypothetical protein LUQ40_04065 [Methanomicrobiales archaeon]|nr:hypothetical protein [Methanomicrobiales archaeon]
MARELSSRDLDILRKLAPEVNNMICEGSGVEFRSILPPVSRHFSLDEQDFAARLEKLDVADLEYLVRVIDDGSESLGCMPPEDVEILAKILAHKISREVADRVVAAYEGGGGCDS